MKRKISLLLALLMLLSIVTCKKPMLAEAAENDAATIDEVIAVSVNMIMNTYQFEDGMHSPFRLRDVTSICDVTGDIVSYYVTFKDLEDNYCGYVIVNASKRTNPIMEFAISSTSFLEEAEKTVTGGTNANIVYFGDGVYGLKTDKLYEVTGEGCKEINESAVIDAYASGTIQSDSNNDTKYKNLWNEQVGAYNKKYNSGSNINSNLASREDGGYVYYPDNYETVSAVSNIVQDGNILYFCMRAFGDGPICVPVTATNLCYYWYRRDASHFAGLYRSSWENVFNTFFEYMETDNETGTNETNAYNGYRWFFNEADIQYSLNYYTGTNNGRSIVSEIDAGYPADLFLHNYQCYIDHSVLAVGYRQYNYDSGESIYIRIADGWGEGNNLTQIPDRYVWGDCQGNWNYISFRPSGY